jgi:hypothetical protein
MVADGAFPNAFQLQFDLPTNEVRVMRHFCAGPPVIVDRDAPVDAVLLGRVVAGGAVIRAAIVPDHDVALFPDVMVLGVGVTMRVSSSAIRSRRLLGALDADENHDLAGIEIERFAPGFGWVRMIGWKTGVQSWSSGSSSLALPRVPP